MNFSTGVMPSCHSDSAWRPRDPAIRNLVSVIVPVYNRQEIVGQALDSILSQTYRPIEILVVDDGSADGSRKVLEDYARRHPGVVTALSQPNSGPAVARNHGIHHARGEFIAFLDSDDTWVPTKLKLQMPLFRAGVGLVYSGIQEIDEPGKTLRTVLCENALRGDIYRHLLVKNRMTGGTVVVRRTALERVGLFDENLRAAENWDLWIRISKEFEVDFVDQPLVRYLKHEENMSRDLQRMRTAAEAILGKHFPHPPQPGDPLQESYYEAYADYFYRWAVDLFTSGDYPESRLMLRRCWQYLPGYQDSRIRFLRSFLGKSLNSTLASVKDLVSNR